MKILSTSLLSIAMLSLFSCGSSSKVIEEAVTTPGLDDLSVETSTEIHILERVVSYTLDVTTREGKAILKNCDLKKAKEQVFAAACEEHKCALIFNPRYRYIPKGKKIVSITVTGQPGIYRNKKSETVIQQQGVVIGN